MYQALWGIIITMYWIISYHLADILMWKSWQEIEAYVLNKRLVNFQCPCYTSLTITYFVNIGLWGYVYGV